MYAPARVACPGCNSTLRLRGEFAGKKIKCPGCGCGIAIPVPAEDEIIEARVLEVGFTESNPRPKALRKPSEQLPRPDLDEDRAASTYNPCPKCGARGARRVMWTAWGSFYGPALCSHVRCPDCGYCYNGRTGQSNSLAIACFVTIPLVLIFAIILVLIFLVLIPRNYL